MNRRFSNDVPNRAPTTRRVTITSHLGSGNYIIWTGQREVAKGPTDPAYAPGASPLARWDSAAGVWMLDSNPREGVRLGFELLVDGRTAANPPAHGWVVSSRGFGAEFTAGPEPATPVGPGSEPQRLAWHPSGRAVAVQNIDSNGFIEVFEWIPGTGFGRKIATIDSTAAEELIIALASAASYPYGSTDFALPRANDFGGQIKFSHDGMYLAICGDAGTYFTNPNALAAYPFSLTTGFDLFRPGVGPDLSVMNDGECLAWAPDDSVVFIGGNGNGGGNELMAIPAPQLSGGFFGALVAQNLPAGGPVAEIAVHPSGEFVAVGLETFAQTTVLVYGWDGAAFSGPLADPASVPTEEIHGLSWHPDGTYLFFNTLEQVGHIEFDASGGGSLGTVTIIETVIPTWDVVLGSSVSPDGTLLVALGQMPNNDNVAKLWTFVGGSASAVESTQWTSLWGGPYVHASVAWRPAVEA